MVWIQGGGFTIGAGAREIYNGPVLARRGDVVVVTINYRLGPLGFLRLNDVTNGRIPIERQRGTPRSARGAGMGPRKYRRIRRRSGQRKRPSTTSLARSKALRF
jgi:hypothetical protein